MATYQKAENHIAQKANHLICTKPQFADLAEVDLKLTVLTAHAARDSEGTPKGPAIKHQGYAAHAVIKINSHQKRVEGCGDVTIIVDGDNCSEWSERRLEAILVHELTHLVVVRDNEGVIKSDDCGRPKLKMRLHDVQIGVFTEVAKEYGCDSVDYEQLNDVAQYVQAELFARG